MSNKDGRIPKKCQTIFKKYRLAGQTLKWSFLYGVKELGKTFSKEFISEATSVKFTDKFCLDR